MSGAWAALAGAIIRLLTGLSQLWIAYRLGKAKADAQGAQQNAEVKDEQAQIAADRPDDRDELVRRVREHGL